MQELIAKRYVKALRASVDLASFEEMSYIMDALADAFEIAKFKAVLRNPSIGAAEKQKLLSSLIDHTAQQKLQNLLSLLAEKRRIDLIPSMAVEMKKALAKEKNSFSGRVYSDTVIDASIIDSLAFNLHKKMGAIITLEFVKNDFDGVKVEVEDLGIEVNFSKNRLNSQLIEHILKAI
ncbi:MAG: F0F1 ATP synthase subunit delta [Campylobacterales bacterium]|nr:F0F1 ATP synthase subunit delta [Campylobacterales bacterium]